MQSLPLTKERQQTKWYTIKTMAQNNKFPEHFITNLKIQMKKQKVQKTQDKDGKKEQTSNTTVQKLENSPTFSNIPT
jgi:hypothetical protein